VNDARQQKSVWEILKEANCKLPYLTQFTTDECILALPQQIQGTYVSQAPYWLTFFP
jgi:hypothetical protein